MGRKVGDEGALGVAHVDDSATGSHSFETLFQVSEQSLIGWVRLVVDVSGLFHLHTHLHLIRFKVKHLLPGRLYNVASIAIVILPVLHR